MKNTFKFELGNVSFTIDETPINIEGMNITIDLDANSQELAQVMTSYKKIFREVKDMIKQENETISVNCGCTHGCCNDDKSTPAAEPKKENIVDVWKPLEKKLVAADFKKEGFGNYKFISKGEGKDEFESNKDSVHIELKSERIVCFTHIGGKDVSIFRHENNKAKCDSLPRECFDEFLGESDLPDNVKDVVMHVLDM